jgi:ferric-dicitrate binding protein FerR (iron transport regulator)
MIERYISGIADESEKEYIESLFLNGEDNYTLRNLLDKDFKAMLTSDLLSEANLLPILDRIHHNIRVNDIIKKKKPLRRFFNAYMKIAAILMIPLLVSGVLAYNYLGHNRSIKTDKLVNSSIYAPLGSRVSFNLPDGTTGMLNSGSRLSYSLPFSQNRHIKLEGEAWLDVTRDANHPFEISAGNSTVKVLGTRFNLSAYPEEKYVEIVLLEGKVEFQNNNGNEKTIILPSERLVFNEGNIRKYVVDPLKYSAWTEGKLVFRGDPMAEVARRIERWYNVKITIADRDLEKYSFRATFQDDSLEDVLHFLSLTSPIKYKITPRDINIDGTIEKEEIFIYKRK